MSIAPTGAMNTPTAPLPALVVGAGPAGLASAACLKQRGIERAGAGGRTVAGEFVAAPLRPAAPAHGQAAVAPARVPFAKELPRYPSRAEVVAYLEAYAARFAIAPRTGEAVRRVRAADGGFVVESARAAYRARAVVIAPGSTASPIPNACPDRSVSAARSCTRATTATRIGSLGQRVLVVGAGNTGAEIALDLAEHGARPTLALRSPVNIVPRDFLGMPTQLTSIRIRRLPLKLARCASHGWCRGWRSATWRVTGWRGRRSGR